MSRLLGTVIPSLRVSNIQWPQQANEFPLTVSPRVAVIATVGYKVQTLITVTAIMEWNIGVPFSGQIIQTAQDRTDFAY